MRYLSLRSVCPSVQPVRELREPLQVHQLHLGSLVQCESVVLVQSHLLLLPGTRSKKYPMRISSKQFGVPLPLYVVSKVNFVCEIGYTQASSTDFHRITWRIRAWWRHYLGLPSSDNGKVPKKFLSGEISVKIMCEPRWKLVLLHRASLTLLDHPVRQTLAHFFLLTLETLLLPSFLILSDFMFTDLLLSPRLKG